MLKTLAFSASKLKVSEEWFLLFSEENSGSASSVEVGWLPSVLQGRH